jgi:hypothetical protein
MWKERPAGRPFIGKIPQTIININCQRSDWGILEAGSRVAARDDNRGEEHGRSGLKPNMKSQINAN